MYRYKCTCAYDGTLFSGFQVQKDLRTVQGEIEAVLLEINKHKTVIYPSGRTDTGVHAIGQVFHFDSEIDMSDWNMQNAINSRLPDDIYVTAVEKAESTFHARFDVKSKEYHYLIDFGTYNPLQRNYRYYCRFKKMDVCLLKEALMIFVGVHDFRSFTKNKILTDTVREIYSIEFEEADSLLTIKIKGSGFMHNMVRILVAMCLEVGRGRLSIDDLKYILAQKNRVFSPKIVPPNGLYLYRVTY
jgi:tRNA pseudouridine38-40 synthase